MFAARKIFHSGMPYYPKDSRSSSTWPRRPTVGQITSRPTGITIQFWHTVWVKKFPSPLRFSAIFPKRIGIF